ncbi:MAG: TonB-dependent receptor [Sphingobacteriales bacterium]|nr:MAG: TonB-dependent receptor [Sphingobacteriales bacterium]
MLFCFGDAYAQQSADTLREVKIRSRRKRHVSNDDRINTFAPGQKVTSIDSLTLQQYQYQTMANLLSQQVPVFVKSYGFNNLATLNFRGSSAAQSQVYWNGVPIQNTAMGMADVSLLPVALISKVNIVYGGSSALWGSGNVGGALLVENDLPAFDTNGYSTHSISAVAGSFGQYQLGLKSGISTSKFAASVSAFGQTAKNDFSYTHNGNQLRMNNALLQSGSLLGQLGYRVDKQNTIKFTGWYQQYYREIPRALFESYSVKNQRDESLRLLAEWNRKGRNNAVHAKAAYLNDLMLYRDDAITLRSDNTTSQLYAEVGLKYQYRSHHQFLLFAPVHLSWMKRELTNDVKQQNRLAIAGAYALSVFRDRLNVAANLRAERINDLAVLLPGLNASFALTDWFAVRANVQRSFRAPTLNELYYQPGGNERLKPEQGWSQDAGYSVRTNSDKRVVFQHDASLFNRDIKDWIIWFGGAIWTPHNIATVNSQGLETENKLSYNLGKWQFHLGVNTSYILAVTEQSYVSNDNSIGMQIPYTPRYNGQLNAGFTYRSWYFNYNHTYTGYRFLTVDESQYLLPYNTGNAQILYGRLLKGHFLQLSLQVNNIWDQKYSVVNSRPMPGINWLTGLRYTL